MACEKLSINNPNLSTYYNNLTLAFDENTESIEKVIDFSKYAPTTSIIEFIARYELVKLIKNIPGDIFELGVCGGKGIFSFFHATSILEPSYELREIIGFDTFKGLTEIDSKDDNKYRKINKGEFLFTRKSELIKLAEIHESYKNNKLNKNRIHFIEGDVIETLPIFLKDNPHKLVSLLYLDMDIYTPTKFSIQTILPRMCKGSVIAFDELYYRSFPGETIALLECLNINNYKIHNILGSRINYIII